MPSKRNVKLAKPATVKPVTVAAPAVAPVASKPATVGTPITTSAVALSGAQTKAVRAIIDRFAGPCGQSANSQTARDDAYLAMLRAHADKAGHVRLAAIALAADDADPRKRVGGSNLLYAGSRKALDLGAFDRLRYLKRIAPVSTANNDPATYAVAIVAPVAVKA